MASMLYTGPLPFWAYLVIIGVGSVIVLAIAAVSIRCCVIRWRRRKKEEVYPGLTAEGPTRQMTVRRGRLVPASHYQSLTGSKFGLNQFNDLESSSNMEGQKNRSRSPFEWWKTVNSQSRQTETAPSVESKPTYHSIANTPEGTFTTRPRTSEKESEKSYERRPPRYSPRIMAPPNHVSNQVRYPPTATMLRPSRQTNFSAPFGSVRRPPLSASTTTTSLPHIIEVSPHQSMIMRQSQLSLARQSQLSISVEKSNNGKIAVHELSPGAKTPLSPPSDSVQLPLSPLAEKFLHERSSQITSSRVSLSSTVTTTTNDRHSLTTIHRSVSQDAIRSSRSLDGRRSSGPGPERKPSSYRKPDTETPVNRTRSLTSIHEVSALPESLETTLDDEKKYWSSRPDVQPARTSSKKRNVLRKKSLKRAEVVSWVEG